MASADTRSLADQPGQQRDQRATDDRHLIGRPEGGEGMMFAVIPISTSTAPAANTASAFSR